MFKNRNLYRNNVISKDLTTFQVTAAQTNLMIHAKKDLKTEATGLVLKYRRYIEGYIEQHPMFAKTLVPWQIHGPAPEIVRAMAEESCKAGVGPMASVAGAVAEFVGKELAELSEDVIIENGGDTFIQSSSPITIGIYAGNSPLSMKIGLRFDLPGKAFSVCTSSGTIGHSLSMGIADAVCIVSGSALLADAAATSVGNRVTSVHQIQEAVNFGKSIDGVTGIVVITGDQIGLWGNVEVVKLLKNA